MYSSVISLSVANRLQQLGFNEPCIEHYVDNLLHTFPYPTKSDDSVKFLLAPRVYQVLDWLFVNYGVVLSVEPTLITDRYGWIFYDTKLNTKQSGFAVFKTFDDAMLAGFNSVISSL